uniref:Uncharacterized protein n=1 Tax=Tetradesmus obliquus TaxID=3088 RepID=A0A383VVG0_TETOB
MLPSKAGCSSISLHPSQQPFSAAASEPGATLQHPIGSSSSSSSRPKRTALLLVSDQRSRLQLHLRSYAVQLATLWHYAAAQNYGLEVYTHDEPLPENVTGHFVKIKGVQHMFELGYDHVLGLDWDM